MLNHAESPLCLGWKVVCFQPPQLMAGSICQLDAWYPFNGCSTFQSCHVSPNPEPTTLNRLNLEGPQLPSRATPTNHSRVARFANAFAGDAGGVSFSTYA